MNDPRAIAIFQFIKYENYGTIMPQELEFKFWDIIRPNPFTINTIHALSCSEYITQEQYNYLRDKLHYLRQRLTVLNITQEDCLRVQFPEFYRK